MQKKHHLRRTKGNHVLSFEMMTTQFCQVGNFLNSRPIGAICKDLKDGEVLTPGHLICGTKLKTFPTIETPKKSDITRCSAVTRWVHIQYVLLHFWKRWSKDDVTSPQERKKWSKEFNHLKIGDVVFITDNNAAPLQWPMGCIAHVLVVLTTLFEWSKSEHNKEFTTELYINFKNCLYRLIENSHFLALSWELAEVWQNFVESSLVQRNFWLYHKFLVNGNVSQVCKFGVPRLFW